MPDPMGPGVQRGPSRASGSSFPSSPSPLHFLQPRYLMSYVSCVDSVRRLTAKELLLLSQLLVYLCLSAAQV